MSLNWKEIELILKEADLQGSKIQAVIQNSFHSLTWQLYKPGRGRFDFYTEVGTQQSRMHLLSAGKKLPKTKKLQRFEQFARKNIEGSVITCCTQMPFDRLVKWELLNHGRKLNVFLRLYSAASANIIVTDSDLIISDLLLRRPGLNEISKSKFEYEVKTKEGKAFEIRNYEGSFNEFIENYYSDIQSQQNLSSLIEKIQKQKDKVLSELENSIIRTKKSLQANEDFNQIKLQADLLSSVSHTVTKGSEGVEVFNWETSSKVFIPLNPSLSAGDNVQNYYDKYHKAKKAWENANEELIKLEKAYTEAEEKFNNALSAPLENKIPEIQQNHTVLQPHPGLHITYKTWDILVGRNAKENDLLLRQYAKPNDTWFHTRDYPGGYVFVKYKKGKTIPLPVMLQAANLAVFYSKGRNNSSADLYYTQVKYLRRAKNGKKGLVIPTREKNLTVKPQPEEAKSLLNNSFQ